MDIRKNDEVAVIRGDDRGKRGKVNRVIPKDERVLVTGVNMVKRHMKPRPNVRQAGIIEREAPVHISNVMLVCAKCHKPTRVGHLVLESKSRVRFCKKCREVID
ncbi:MAG: 50S ribosomal protein L24 [Dehalococcoidia bacterium]|nr:50S ribosomal protein L24 [Dehalococcoidia bacterium]